MAEFLKGLVISLREDSDTIYVLGDNLIYESDIVGRVVVPKGFQTDFASVPRVPIAYMLFGDRAHREAVLHDYLYRIDSQPQATYSQANNVFFEAMKLRGKGFFVRYGMYWGVVLGGWTAYHKKKVSDKL
jgi:hypothetical protein